MFSCQNRTYIRTLNKLAFWNPGYIILPVCTNAIGIREEKLYEELNQMVAEEVPLLLGVHRAKIVLKHSWLKNYKFSTFNHGHAKYYDVDMKAKEKKIKSGVLQQTVEKKTASN